MGEEVYQNRHDRGYGILQARREQGKVRDERDRDQPLTEDRMD